MGEKPKRNIYLKMKTLEEARRLWTERTAEPSRQEETIPTVEALRRVTARPTLF